MKKYQVMFQDEYNNLYNVGFYDNLKDAIPDVNEHLTVYDTKIEELEEYVSTFGMCFDREIENEDGVYIMVRGFIHE